MQKKFQIFVSSTFIDLEEERRAVIEAILDLGHIPIGMEAFQASNEEQWSYIKKRIDETDYYAVIVAERYGSENVKGLSYTEMEYDYAREKGVPVAAFLLHENARPEWRSKKADCIDDRKKVDAFRAKCQNLMVRFWNNKDELASACVKSLSQMFTSHPRDGWLPARDAIKPETANEIARLSEENDRLRREISLLQDKKSFDGGNIQEILADLREYTITPINATMGSSNKNPHRAIEFFEAQYSWSMNGVEAVRIFFRELIEGTIKEHLEAALSRHVAQRHNEEIRTSILEAKLGMDYWFRCKFAGIDKIIEFLVLSGIVTKKGDMMIFTEKGKSSAYIS